MGGGGRERRREGEGEIKLGSGFKESPSLAFKSHVSDQNIQYNKRHGVLYLFCHAPSACDV